MAGIALRRLEADPHHISHVKQIIGTVKLELAPLLNDWWNVAFVLTARGLTTSTIPYGPASVHAIADMRSIQHL